MKQLRENLEAESDMDNDDGMSSSKRLDRTQLFKRSKQLWVGSSVDWKCLALDGLSKHSSVSVFLKPHNHLMVCFYFT